MNYRPLLEIPPPRKARRTSAVKTCHVVFAVVTMVLALVIIAIESKQIEKRKALVDHGQIAQASVYDKTTSSKSNSYRLLFEFLSDNERFTGFKPVSEEEFNRAKVGDSVTVTYLPENPQVMLVGKVDSSVVSEEENQLVWMLLVVVGAGVVAWITFQTIIWRDMNLMEHGFAVEGEVMTISPRAVNNTLYYSTNFQYLLNGEPTMGRIELTSSQGRTLKPGDRLILLVNPATPTNPRLPESLKFAESPDLAILGT